MAKDFAERYLGKEDDITVNFMKKYDQAVSEITPKLAKINDLDEKKEKTRNQQRAISSLNQTRKKMMSSNNAYNTRLMSPNKTQVFQKRGKFKNPTELIGISQN